ncbi:hypothetical protein BH09PAT3_BH09PAT3_1310 [soil metagenome]
MIAIMVAAFSATLMATVPASAAASFTVDTVSPNTGSAAGGDSITITGTNFTAGMTVRVDGIAATSVVVQNSTTITAQTPASSPGTVSVSVTSSTSETIIKYDAYTYSDAVAITATSITPNNGTTGGGTSVAIAGGGFAGFVPFSSIKASVAGDSMCGIAAGAAYCWGLNGAGRLGDGTTSTRLTPTKVTQAIGFLAGKTVTAISVGSGHTCAIADGEAYCWGNNANGQVGDGVAGGTRTTPVKVAQASNLLLGKTVTAISAGTNHTCAVADGKAYCWGLNTNGELGDTSNSTRISPVAVQPNGLLAGKTVTSIAAGSTHTCAVASGEAYCWGNNTSGKLGNTSTTASVIPVKVTQTSGILLGKVASSITAGINHTCAIADGEAYCWGANGSGRLGDNTTTVRTAPIKVTQTTGVLAGKVVSTIVAANTHTCAVADSQAYCWGANSTNGKLGDGGTVASSVPVLMSAANALYEKKTTEVVLGGEYTCALARGNSYCFGENVSGEFGNGTTTSSTTPSKTSITNGSVPLELTIGGQIGTIVSQTSSQVNAVTPANTSGVKTVSLRRTDTNQTATLANSYQYIGPPAITSVAPTSGAMAGGDIVSIYGESFVNGATVKFGSNAATNVTYVSDTRIDVTTPASLSSGLVAVTLTNPDAQQTQLANAYTYVPPPPTLTSLTQVRGKMGGANTIQLNGTNFSASTAPTVTFDGVAATNVTITNATTATVTVPASTTVKKATVTYADSYAHSSSLIDSYTYLPQSYVFTTSALTLSATEPGQMTVLARNTSGNPVTVDDQISLNLSSSAATGYFALTTDESGGDPWNITAAPLTPGSSSATFYYKDNAKGTPTITVADALGTNVTQGATITSRFKFQVTGVSDPIAAGIPSSVTVRAVDYRGQPETSYTGTVHFTSTDTAATLPANFVMTSAMKGVRTFVNGVMLTTPGEHCVTASDTTESSVTGTQCDITTTSPPSGSIARLRYITPEQHIAANKTSSAITIQAQDSSGAPVAVTQDTSVYITGSSATAEYSTTGTASWSTTDPTLIIKAGTTAVTFYYRDTVQQTSQLLATDRSTDTDTIDAGLTNHIQTITTGTGEAAKFVIDDPGSIAVHDIHPVVIRLADDTNNTVTTEEDVSFFIDTTDQTIALYETSNGSPVLTPYAITIPAGSSQATIYVSATSTGTATITATDTRGASSGSYTTASRMLTFSAALPYSVHLTTPANVPVKSGTAMQLQLYDQYGNVSPTSQNTDIDLTTSNGAAEFRASANGSAITTRAIPGGTSSATVYYYSNTIGNYTVSAGGSGLIGDTQNITVQAGPPAAIAVSTAASSMIAGTTRQLSFEIRDANGFATAVTSDTTITLASALAGQFSTDGTTWNATSVLLSAGSSSGSFYYRNTTAQNDTITLTTSPGNYSTNYSQTITAAAPRQLHFNSNPQTISKNTSSTGVRVTFTDSYGNAAVADSSTVITFSDNSGSGEFSRNSTGPWASTPSITVTPGLLQQVVYYRSANVGDWTMSASASSYLSDSQAITVTEAAASKANLSLNETSIQAGEMYAVTLSTLSSDDQPSPVASQKTFSLSSTNGGQFSETQTPFTPISTTNLAGGASSKTLYYRAQTLGVATMTASADGLSSASLNLPVTAGTVYRFVASPTTQDIAINTSSAPYTVTTQDTYGNVSPVSGNTTVYLYSDSNTGSFSGNGQSNITAGGSATTFTYQDSAFKSAPVAITASDKSSLDNPDVDIQNTTATATIISSAPDALVFTSGPQTITAGEYSAKITIDLRTAGSQPAHQDGSTSVTLTSNSTGSFYAQSGDTATISNITVPRGTASVDIYYRGTASGAHTLTARYGSSPSATQNLTITADEADRMSVVSAQQQIVTGNASGQIITKFYDQYMNETTLDANEHIELGSSCVTGQFSLSSTTWQAVTEVDVTAGSDQLILYYKDTEPATCTLTVTGDALGAASQQITVAGTTASQLQLSLDDATIEAGQTATATVRVTDTFGNTAPVSSTTTLYFRSTSANATFNRTSFTLNAGQSQTTFTYRDTIPGSATIAASDQPGEQEAFGSLSDASTGITVSQGAPAKLSLSGASTAKVGDPYQLSIQVLNAYDVPTPVVGNTQLSLSSNQTGNFSLSANGTTTTTATLPAGDSQMNVYYQQTQASQANLTIDDGVNGLTGSSKAVSFSAMNVASMQFTGSGDAITGEYKARTVQLLDRYGNSATLDTPVTMYFGSTSQTAKFYSNPNGQPITNLEIPSGSNSFTFYVRDTEPGTATITVDDNTIGSTDTGIQKLTQSMQNTYGLPSGVDFQSTSFSVIRGAVHGPVSVALVNAAGSVIPAPQDTVITFQSSGNGEVAATPNSSWANSRSVTIPAGQLNASTYIRNFTGAESTSYLLIASTDLNGTSVNDNLVYNVTYGAPSQIVFSTPEQSVVANHTSNAITAELRNAYGAAIPSSEALRVYLRSNHTGDEFSASTQGPWGVNYVTLPQSQEHVTAYFRATESGVRTITAADTLPVSVDSGLTNANQQMTVTEQEVDHFYVANISDPQRAGTASSVIVIAQDEADLTVPSYAGTITFSSDDQNAVLPSSYTFSPAQDKGSKTFTNGVAFKTTGEKTVTVSDANGVSGEQQAITVTTPNTLPTRSIVFTAPPSPYELRPGQISQAISVERRDEFGEPTVGTAALPIRLISDSPSGQFALSASGPWNTSLVTSIPSDLASTTLYYRDTNTGDHTLIVQDWISNTDNPTITNGTMTAAVMDHEISEQTTITSLSAVGGDRASTYLFAHNEAGEITSNISSTLTSRHVPSEQPYMSDWQINLKRAGTTIDSFSASNTGQVIYQLSPFNTTSSDSSLSLTASSTSTDHGDYSKTIAVPVSPWSVRGSGTWSAKDGVQVTATISRTRSDNALRTVRIVVYPYDKLTSPMYQTALAADEPGTVNKQLPSSALQRGSYVTVTQLLDSNDAILGEDMSDVFSVNAEAPIVIAPTIPITPTPAGETSVTEQPVAPTDEPTVSLPIAGVLPSPEPGKQSPDAVTTGAFGALQRVFKAIAASPYTPIVIPLLFLIVLGIFAAIMVAQILRQLQFAARMRALIVKDKQTSHDKRQFLNLIAHHLRTPVTIITGSVELLGALPQTKEASAALVAPVKNLADITNNLVHSITERTQVPQDDEPVANAGKIYTLPSFWIAASIGVGVLVAVNIFVSQVGSQSVSAFTYVTQFVIIASGLALLYFVLQERANQRRITEQTKNTLHHRDQLDNAKNAAIQTIASELSTILASCQVASASIIASGSPGTAQLNNGLQQLQKIITTMQTIAQIHSAQATAQPIDLQQTIVGDLVAELETIKTKHIQLQESLDAPSVIADPALFSILVASLLDNAIAFSPDAGTISVTSLQANNNTVITITDKGPGMPKEIIKGISRPFTHPGDEMSETHQGLGLSLYLDTLIMRHLGGSITFVSSKQGTTVELTLPSTT